MKKSIFIALSIGAIAFTSCKKEGCTDSTATNYSSKAKKDDGSCTYAVDDHEHTGSVMIAMDHQWGDPNTAFQLNTQYVHSSTGDTMTFTTMKYYISNLKLKKSDGTWWSHPESYFLVDLSIPSSTMFTLADIPEGNYTEVSYVMGVDSVRNVSGAQTGALSTTNGMFWSWNTGYIMIKAEGTSPQSSSGSFSYHLGGFSGSNNIVTLKTDALGGGASRNRNKWWNDTHWC